jgi:hypothetical protein
MAAWSDFVPLVSPEAAGCADIVIENAVRRAAIEFCEKTLCLQRTLSGVTTVVGQAEYAFTQANEVIERLLAVKVNAEPVNLMAPHHTDWERTPVNGAAQSASLSGVLSIRLYPAPSIAGYAIQARAAMRPSRAAASLDDAVFERFADAIADGAVYRICATPNRAYTDPNKAAEAAMRFQQAIDSAREGTYRNNTRTSTARMRAL